MFKNLILAVALIAILPGQLRAESTTEREYKIKAAFLYNFIKFVEWPKAKEQNTKEPIIIGIIGKDPFKKAFEPLKNKQIKSRKVIVKRFKNTDKIEDIKKCHLLFISPSEKKQVKKIVKLIQKYDILTVSDIKGFAKSDGIIQFSIVKKKLGFMVNTKNAKKQGLKIRSKLLRLAKKVIE